MQHGANRATPPAKNAARTDPVVSRSPTAPAPSGYRVSDGGAVAAGEDVGELAARETPVGEERAVEEHQWAHRGPVLGHQHPPGVAPGINRVHDDGVAAGELGEHLVGVSAVVAGR